MNKNLSVLLIAASLSACTASGPKYNAMSFQEPVKNNAQLIFYRPSGLIGALEEPTISVNNQSLCSLTSGSYFVKNYPVGDISVTASNYGGNVYSKTSASLSRGKKYFFRLAYGSQAVLGGFGLIGGAIAGAVQEDNAPYTIRLVSVDQEPSDLLDTGRVDCN